MGQRRLGRELALQALYGLEVNKVDLRRYLADFWEEHQAPAEARNFADLLIRGVVEKREAVDAAVKKTSTTWSLSRMARVDLTILRVAAYELLFVGDVPKNVSINEAIEIARKFGSEDSPSFVNGILDEIASTLPDKEPNTSEREEP